MGEYNGNVIELRGLALGETELVLTANGKEKRVPVSVTEGILSVLWKSGNARTLFEGQTVQWGIDAKTLSGGENPYDVTWTSLLPMCSLPSKPATITHKGRLRVLRPVRQTLLPEVAGVSSEKAEVKVIALPVDLELNASNTVKENSVVYDEGGDLVVFISPTSGYGQIMLTLTDAYKGGGYAGHYDIPVGTVVDIDGARAEVTAAWISRARRRDNRFVLDYGNGGKSHSLYRSR